MSRAALSLARSFSSGGTLWCATPDWSWHARHVAVEFVHPVIMGTRALPAVALHGPDWVSTLRSSSRSGDFLLFASASASDVFRLAPAWGLTTMWIGPGSPLGPADFVLPLPGSSDEVAFGGGLVRAYHLLWELVHVCLEHPGLMTGPTAPEPDHCTTCSDEGRLGEVLTCGPNATVRSPAGVEPVDLTLVPDAAPGDLVLVHAGLAISKVAG